MNNYHLFARVEAVGNDLLEGSPFVAHWLVTPQLIDRLEAIVNDAPETLGGAPVVDIELSERTINPKLLFLLGGELHDTLYHLFTIPEHDEDDATRFFILPETGNTGAWVDAAWKNGNGTKYTFFQPTLLVHASGGELRWRFEVANGPGYLETALLYVENLVEWADRLSQGLEWSNCISHGSQP